ncbi:MAG TPA: hypothetical protein DD381_12595 [Lentisphaeria bacterium]|nr:MAG: hypothetical protein A2X47_12165 [Lentisphaerae bacterium GWF2_38_69]HBM17163.1 hypothetical protein [Lentisphaeria bacterium]
MSFNFKHKDQKLQQSPSYAPGKRHLSKVYWYLLLIMILSPFVYLGYKIFTDTFLMSANGHIMFGEVVLRSPSNAYVDQVLLTPGDSFEKGQSLMLLSSPQLLSELRTLDEEILTLEEKKKKLLSDDSELNHLLIARTEAAKYMESSKYYLKVWEDLKSKGQTSIANIEKALYDLNTATQGYKALDREIAKLQTNKKLQSEEYFDKNIRATEAKIKILKTSLELLTIKAPEAGTLAKVVIHENEYVKDGQDIAIIVVNRNIYIIAYVESKFLSKKLKANQEVNILFPDGEKIKGIVSATPIFAEMDPSRSNIVSSDKKKILIRVLPKENIPHKYKIACLPVDILFY